MRRALLTTAVLAVMLVASGTAGDPTSATVAPTSAPIEPLTDALSTVTLLPSKDNTLYESATGSLSNGVGQHFFAGKTNGGLVRRGVIAFDVAGNIPAGSTINSVSLTLSMSKTSSGAQAVSIHTLSADWGEGSSDAPSTEGPGTTAAPGDATWVHSFFDTVTWITIGGDFSAAASASTSVADAGSYKWSSAQAVSDVQAWLDDSSDNFGWLLKGNEDATRTTKRFDTKENGTPSNRPKLTVQYTPPTPSALSIGDVTIAENGGDAVLTISMDNTATTDVTVQVATADGTATSAGQDYTAVAARTITIPAGATTASTTIAILDDTIDELDETFSVTISNPTGGALIADGNATVTIVDDDPPTVFVDAAITAAEASGVVNVPIRIADTGTHENDIVVTYDTIDGTAIAPGDYTAIVGGQAIITAGQSSGTIRIVIVADAVIEVPAETFTVTLTGATTDNGARNVPIDQTKKTVEVTIVENPTFSIVNVTVTENGGTSALTIALNPTSTSATSVQYKTVAGTAKAGSDYVAVTSNTTSFAPGQTTTTVQISIVNDSFFELQESFTVQLFNNQPSATTLIDPARFVATVTINDDDSANQPKLTIADETVTEAPGVSVTLTITNQSAAHNEQIVVTYRTVDGTANAGLDFVGVTSGTISIPANQTSAFISSGIVNDDNFENDETFTVELTGATPSGISEILTSTATVTIVDDDTAPIVSIEDAAVREDAGSVILTLAISATTPLVVTVGYTTADGTARAGADYGLAGSASPVTGTAFILPGTLSSSITIPIIDDADPEPAESFTVTLTAAGNATISGTAASATVTILDDDTTSVDVPLVLGFNLIGVPVRLATTTRFQGLAEQIADQGGQISAVLAWNELAQGFESWVAINPDPNNDPVEQGDAYFVRVVQAPVGDAWRASGAPITESVPIDFVLGFNLISVPFQTPQGGYKAADLAQAITDAGGSVSSILSWKAASQTFETWVATNPAPSNFPIDPVAGYFVRVTMMPPASFVP